MISPLKLLAMKLQGLTIQLEELTMPLHILLILTKLFHLYLMAALPLSFLSLYTMLTLTPEGKVPDSLRETGQGLQFIGEDWITLASC